MESITRPAAIGVDVGGTTVDAGVVTRKTPAKGSEMVGKIARIESPSDKPFDEMIQQFGNLIVNVKHDAEESGYDVGVVGVAMPGPFKYEEGVSEMEQKFQDAYGKNFPQPLIERAERPVYFVNDADAFGLGVYSKLHPNEKRLMALTLGTGSGSTFIVNGELATEVEAEQNNIPPKGEIWDIPYKESILEDYVSKRAVEATYEKATGQRLEVHEIAELAHKQDPNAVETFSVLGENIGKSLVDVIAKFQPTIIVLGGQISKSLDLFKDSALKALKEKNPDFSIPISAAVDENYAIYGAAYYASRKAEIGS